MLQVNSITKSFGKRRVLDRVSFTVQNGRMTGFVGANGAGKTTTMRILLGVLEADSGEILEDGKPLTDFARTRFGYMPEERGLYPKSKVLDQLVYLARLHGISKSVAKRQAETLLQSLGLSERQFDTVESLSLGNQQRVQIAAALVHNPSMLVLDEPFSGLDPYAVETVLQVLREYADRGVSVLFSSHQLEVVERLCDDVIVIGKGQILANDSRDKLRSAHDTNLHEIEINAPADFSWIANIAGIKLESVTENRATFRVENAGNETPGNANVDDAAQLVLQETLNRHKVLRFNKVIPTLAEIFKEVTGA